jgi:putative membrane protein
MMYWENEHMGAGWGFVMMLGMLAFWALVVVAVVWVARSTRPPTSPPPPGPPPPVAGAEQILAERLARGEIDPEEYQRRLSVLKTPV